MIEAADLDRATNTGRIYHLHRATLAPAGCDNQGRTEARQWPGTDQPMAAEACNEIGAEPTGKHRDSIFKTFALWLRRAR